jgi:hypothetical protein
MEDEKRHDMASSSPLICSSQGDEAHHFNSAFKIPNSAFEMSLLTSAATSGSGHHPAAGFGLAL